MKNGKKVSNSQILKVGKHLKYKGNSVEEALVVIKKQLLRYSKTADMTIENLRDEFDCGISCCRNLIIECDIHKPVLKRSPKHGEPNWGGLSCKSRNKNLKNANIGSWEEENSHRLK